jgi:hypothetical protein
MRTLFVLASAIMLSVVACTPTVESANTGRDAGAPAETMVRCTALPAALRACTPVQCTQPHPLANFTIHHEILGMDGDACVYNQSMPSDMMMRCRFSESGRAEYAAEIGAYQSSGELSGHFSSSEPPQQDVMTRECEVIDSDGHVWPWGMSSGR